MFSLPKEVLYVLFSFQQEWKFFFHCKKLLSLQKIHTFCQNYNSNLKWQTHTFPPNLLRIQVYIPIHNSIFLYCIYKNINPSPFNYYTVSKRLSSHQKPETLEVGTFLDFGTLFLDFLNRTEDFFLFTMA